MKKLNYENALDVFRKNDNLKNRVWSDALENESYFMADEILSYFRHYNEATQRRYETLANYSIDYCAAWVKPSREYLQEFFEDCITVADVFGIMDDLKNVSKKLQRAAEKVELLNDANVGYYDMSDENYNRLEKWIDEVANEAAEYIAEYAQDYYTQFDDSGILEDYFLTYWLEYNDELEVDDAGNVYETITRKI